MLRVLFQFVGLIGIALSALYLIGLDTSQPSLTYERPVEERSDSATTTPSGVSENATSTAPKITKATSTPVQATTKKPVEKAQNTANDGLVYRIDAPYSFLPKTTEEVNSIARSSLVNILCVTAAGSLNPISGSGVIIDSKGVILTNAHVAQYILLSTRPELNLSCEIRSGSPARSRWKASVMYLPDAWVREHAEDIRSTRPMGTGEHDFALLAITANSDGSPATGPFPAIPFDAREAIGFVGDRVVAAAYPAEFSGGIVTQNELYAASAISTIQELFTFSEKPVDLLSLGSVILAQSGSSGGAVVNDWGRLIGVITTTSSGATTGDRDVRGITLSYIDRSLLTQKGKGLASFMSGDPISTAINFMSHDASALIQQIVNEIPRR